VKVSVHVLPPFVCSQKVIETKKRSLVKALGWRLTAGLVTFCTSYYFTHSLASAGAIVGSDFLSKAGTMYIGERLFSKVLKNCLRILPIETPFPLMWTILSNL